MISSATLRRVHVPGLPLAQIMWSRAGLVAVNCVILLAADVSTAEAINTGRGVSPPFSLDGSLPRPPTPLPGDAAMVIAPLGAYLAEPFAPLEVDFTMAAASSGAFRVTDSPPVPPIEMAGDGNGSSDGFGVYLGPGYSSLPPGWLVARRGSPQFAAYLAGTFAPPEGQNSGAGYAYPAAVYLGPDSIPGSPPGSSARYVATNFALYLGAGFQPPRGTTAGFEISEIVALYLAEPFQALALPGTTGGLPSGQFGLYLAGVYPGLNEVGESEVASGAFFLFLAPPFGLPGAFPGLAAGSTPSFALSLDLASRILEYSGDTATLSAAFGLDLGPIVRVIHWFAISLPFALDTRGTVGVTAEIVQEFGLHPANPNPFRGSTVIRYSLPSEGHVELLLFDVRGRRVATLVNQIQASGDQEVTWHATDRSGRRLPAGTYYIRLVHRDAVLTESALLNR